MREEKVSLNPLLYKTYGRQRITDFFSLNLCTFLD
jgi:hypothetical protein